MLNSIICCYVKKTDVSETTCKDIESTRGRHLSTEELSPLLVDLHHVSLLYSLLLFGRMFSGFSAEGRSADV